MKRMLAIDVRSLAISRIAIAAVLIYDLFCRLPFLDALYGAQGVVPADTAREFFDGTWSWSLYFLSPSSAFQHGLFGLTLVSSGLLLVGFKTRFVTPACWLLWASLHTRNPLVMTGGDVLSLQLLFWGMFLPWGDRFSYDARRLPPSARSVLSPASAVLLLQVALMYFVTGLWKCNSSWFDGGAIRDALNDQMIVRWLGRMVFHQDALLAIATFLTLGLELIGPWLLFVSTRARILALAAFATMHLAIESLMIVLMFSLASWAALCLFIPGSVWDRLGSWWKKSSHSLDASEASPLDARGGRFAWTLGGLVAGYLCFYNAMALVGFDNRQAWQRIAKRPAEVFAWGQRWSMFAEPHLLNREFVVSARLRDGRRWDLIRNELFQQDAVRSASRFPSHRWMLLFRELGSEPNQIFRAQALEFISRNWAPEPPMEVLEAELIEYWTPLRQKGRRRSLAQVDLRAQGGYKTGLRQGAWVFHDDTGAKRAKGPFRYGLQHGTWTIWDEDGNKSVGPYANGQMHGEWEFWFADGSTAKQMFERDSPVVAPR